MKRTSKIIFNTLLFLYSFSIVFGGPSSAITLLDKKNVESYIEPLGTMLTSSTNSGCFNKASTHKIFGYDITFNISYPILPSNSQNYDFIIPDDSITYYFQFKYPKKYLVANYSTVQKQDALLTHIADYNTQDDPQYNNDGLYQDYVIPISLPLDDLIFLSEEESAPTILGDSESILLDLDFSVTGDGLHNQILDSIWLEVKGIPGVGSNLDVYDLSSEPDRLIATIVSPFDSASFKNYFAEEEAIRDTLQSQLEAMDIALIIPGGFGHVFDKSSLALPILQASFGLPYHTEITARLLPKLNISSIGTLRYRSIGGKIDISKHINDLLYWVPEYTNELNISSHPDIFSINIKPEDVNIAINDFKANKLDVEELDSLNYLFLQGDSLVVQQIQSIVRKTVDQNQILAKNQATGEKQIPFELSLGYYMNYYKFSFGTPEITSTNSMISIQAGKNIKPSIIPWFEGKDWFKSIEVYGGIEFGSSNIDLSYEYINTFDESDDISVSFKTNKLSKYLIGTRVKILFFDAYLDYNIGASNTINAGFGITFN